MKLLYAIVMIVFLTACSSPKVKTQTVVKINEDMDALVTESVAPSKSDAVNKALLPPITIERPKVESRPLEPRFDLAVNNTSAKEVFAAIGSGTRYNMLPLPGVEGNITLNLKDVTVFEALDTIRALYGYEYKMEGKSIYIQPVAQQIKLFKIDYLAAMRNSSSSLSVKALGSKSDAATNSTSITTTQDTASFNFWENLQLTLNSIVKSADSSVTINRMSGVIVIRAMPQELRNVAEFLKASQMAVERQVIIEAKFLEVTLSDGYQSGVNWGAFGTKGNNNLSAGIVSQGAAPTGVLSPATAGVAGALTTSALSATPGATLGAAGAGASVFGMAFQSNNFAAMLSFLESQGSVHVLSSPRIATLNNQKAVLKVGTEEPYATAINAGQIAGVNNAGTTPTPQYNNIFSGIALDVTPRINEKDEIILHVHPSISQVTSKQKDAGGGVSIGMASISIEETDSVVRAKDGQIVVIGGLMSQSTIESNSGLPGWVKSIFGQTSKTTEKRELVILLKPTVVDSDKDWSDDITRSRDRMNEMSQ